MNRHGCNVTTCPKSECQAIGQCVTAALPVVPSPPLAPDLRYKPAPRTITIKVPDGYESVDKFIQDCGYERA